MQVVKKKRVKVEITEDRLCNKCGESLKVNEQNYESGPELYGLMGVRIQGGYFSPWLEDGALYEFDLCEKCLKKLFKTFKHSPIVGHLFDENYMGSTCVKN
jgi:hypothetical protein